MIKKLILAASFLFAISVVWSGDYYTINKTGASFKVPVLISAGTNSAPSFSTILDLDTGIYFPDTNTMVIVGGGVAQLVVSPIQIDITPPTVFQATITVPGIMNTGPITQTGSGPASLNVATTTLSFYVGTVAGEISTMTVTTFNVTMNGNVISQVYNTYNVSVASGTGWDSREYLVGYAPTTMTVTDTYAACLSASATIQFRLEERAWNAWDSAGTNIFTVAESSANTGVHETSFANSNIAQGAGIFYVTDTSADAGGCEAIALTIVAKDDR